MKKIVSICGGILVCSLAASAQEPPKFDIFAGYSYLHYGQSDADGKITSNLNGGVGSFAIYPNKWLGLVADIGGHKLSEIRQGSISLPIDGSFVSYFFGPRIRYARGPVTPFVQVLFGGVRHGDITTNSPGACAPVTPPCTVSNSENGFGMTADGGIDFNVARHFALRGQAGYLMTRFQESTGTAEITGTQNNLRVAVGIVIH